MDSKKFVMSYSGGKDCMLAMYKKIKEGFTPVALITTIKKDSADSWTHSINKRLLEEASKSLNIPIIYVECDISEYETEFEKKLLVAKEMGATTVVYGDIDIELHRQWDIDRATNAGLDYELPLWNGDREGLVHEFIDSGFKAVIKKVNLENMSENFLGKVLDKELVEEIKKTGSDACGENGEYHTIVVDGPIFSKPINLEILGKTIDNGYGILDVK
ncbi:MAG: diphthine--ammonia ligase [Intestinibacter sp.]|uniref:Dph6-related ATP pyrophosphatase n=1 Tax=Intestinibacter sp. TaxID=1965304 RepID=UPI002A82CB11|nr:diphthine--ammonia ligase [Intestinibacter sp.]MDY4573663.1 diphthine--ammonia ligase [Intestinibacter sp.]